MRAWRTAMLALAAGLLTALAGCDSGGGRPACPPGKTCLEFGNMGDPVSLDPHKTTLVNDFRILQDMFTGLLQYDADSQPVPGLATTWETSADGLTWTFHLRESKWSDGAPLTADDFVYSLRRILEPKTASEYAYLLYVIRNGEAVNSGKLPPTALGVAAPDARTLRIQLDHPTPYLLWLTVHQTMYPVPRHVIDKWGDAWTDPSHWVSNGPYVLKQFKLGDRVHVERNPNFYQAGSLCVDQINYYPTVDSISAERRVRRGELDINDDIQSNRIPYLKQPGQMPGYVHIDTWLGTVYLVFNKKNQPALGDVRVRQALTMAIDRDFIAKKLLGGGQDAAQTLVPPGTANYPGAAPPHWAGWSLARRQAEAKRLLAAAGFDARHPLRFELKMRNTADPMLIYPAVQADWAGIGAQATLAPEESQIAYADYRARDFQAADTSWIADYNDPMTFLYLQRVNAGSANYADYANPNYDALLDKADHESDIVRRGQYLAQAEHMMLEDAPIAPIYYYVSKNLVNPRVTGWRPNLPDWHADRWVCFKRPG